MARLAAARWYIGLFAGSLEAVGSAELSLELVDPAGCIDEFLLAGEEGVAFAADIDCQAGRRAAGGKRVAAGTVDRTSLVTRVNFGFHWKMLLLPPDRASPHHAATSARGINFTSESIQAFESGEPATSVATILKRIGKCTCHISRYQETPIEWGGPFFCSESPPRTACFDRVSICPDR